MTPDTILVVPTIAGMLQCSEEQVEQLMRSGELPATKIGRSWITTYEALYGFVSKRIAAPRDVRGYDRLQAFLAPSQQRSLPELPDIRSAGRPDRTP